MIPGNGHSWPRLSHRQHAATNGRSLSKNRTNGILAAIDARSSIAGFVLSLAFVLAPSAHAQEASASSASSATPESSASSSAAPLTAADRARALADAFSERPELSRSALLQNAAKEETVLEAAAADRPARIAARAECRQEIRKANRDAKSEVILRCYRAELSQEKTQLRRESALLEVLPGVTQDVRAQTRVAHDAMLSALQTLLDGIDAGVYGDATLLTNAKKRLHTQYRVPQRASLLRLRADRALAWVILIARRLPEALQDAPQKTEEQRMAALGCLESQRDLLTAILASNDYLKMKDLFGQYQSAVPGCAESVRAALPVSASNPAADPGA